MSTYTIGQRRVRLPAVALFVVALGVLALVYVLFFYDAPGAAEPPPAYELAGEADLASRAFAEEAVMAFSLEEATAVGIFYALENVDTGYFELSLSGADGESRLLLRSQGLRTDQEGSGLWEEELPAGRYRLLLTADQGQGMVTLYRGTLE